MLTGLVHSQPSNEETQVLERRQRCQDLPIFQFPDGSSQLGQEKILQCPRTNQLQRGKEREGEKKSLIAKPHAKTLHL